MVGGISMILLVKAISMVLVWNGILEVFSPSIIDYLYYGEFRNNQREGYGILNKIDKECYIGCWKNNQKHSYGKTYSKEGKLIVKG